MTTIREITVEAAAQKLGRGTETFLVDVREPDEWARGRIRGSLHLPLGTLTREIEHRIPDRKTEIVLYCAAGYRSATAADNLQKMGYVNVYSLAGGWHAWVEKKLPIE
jgi:rhodanese-related sulfurtransferase